MVNLFKSFKKKKKEAQKVTKIIDDPEEINKLREAELGRTKAERDFLKQKVEQVEKEKESIEKVNVSKNLALQKKEFVDNRYRGAFSLRMLFTKEFQNNKHNVMSFDFKKKFGQFHDFIILKDGQFSLIIKNGKKLEPLVTGSRIKDLLRHFRGLSDTVGKGFFVVNLDSDGSYVEDIMEREIPHIITDGNGKIVTSKINSAELYKIIAEKDAYVNDLISDCETYEETIRRQTDELNTAVAQTKMSRTRAVTAETQQLEDWKKISEILKNYRSLIDENVDQSQQLQISKKEAGNLESIRAKLTKVIKEVYSKTDKELAQADLTDAINNVMGYVGPILTEKFAQPKQVAAPPSTIVVKTAKPKTPLEEKYKKGEGEEEDDDEKID